MQEVELMMFWLILYLKNTILASNFYAEIEMIQNCWIFYNKAVQHNLNQLYSHKHNGYITADELTSMCVPHNDTRFCQSSTVNKLVCSLDFSYTTAHHSQLCNHPFKWLEIYKDSKVASEIRAFFIFKNVWPLLDSVTSCELTCSS